MSTMVTSCALKRSCTTQKHKNSSCFLISIKKNSASSSLSSKKKTHQRNQTSLSSGKTSLISVIVISPFCVVKERIRSLRNWLSVTNPFSSTPIMSLLWISRTMITALLWSSTMRVSNFGSPNVTVFCSTQIRTLSVSISRECGSSVWALVSKEVSSIARVWTEWFTPWSPLTSWDSIPATACCSLALIQRQRSSLSSRSTKKVRQTHSTTLSSGTSTTSDCTRSLWESYCFSSPSMSARPWVTL